MNSICKHFYNFFMKLMKRNIFFLTVKINKFGSICQNIHNACPFDQFSVSI